MHGQLSVIVALVVEIDIEALFLLKHPCYILVDIGCVDDEEEIVFAHLIDEQVVHGAAVGVAHHTIIDLSYGRACDIVGEDVLDVALSVGACDAHFSHVRDVEDTAVLAHGVVLVGDVGVLNRHNETAERRHECAELHVAVIKAGFLFHNYLVDKLTS